MLKAIENWFDIRPRELQRVVACVFGAFFLLAYVILARSIREGLFLTVFDAKKLPYITAAVACPGGSLCILTVKDVWPARISSPSCTATLPVSGEPFSSVLSPLLRSLT